jgi:hypothetical protein
MDSVLTAGFKMALVTKDSSGAAKAADEPSGRYGYQLPL